ncbi:YceI family protein [Ekhidna sp.]|uniref:YceI family protein n=1 Tax=Ekhidna sp. TaxID=2608089 RepID=UPI00329A3C3A
MKTFLRIIFLLLFTNTAFSQVRFHPDKSMMTLAGTSSLHDWESTVLMDQMKVELHVEETDPLLLGHLRLDIPVKSIKSGKSIMDNKTYSALKSDDFPAIKYEVEVFDYNNGEIIASDGKLKVAGEERKVPVTAVYHKKNNNQIMTFQGSVSFNMTDFNVEPPTAMLGTIKTGDEITITYKITVEINL